MLAATPALARRRCSSGSRWSRPRELHRGRDHRDPEEHRRRASAGVAASMNFDLTEDQREIKRTARDWLVARYPIARVREIALDGGADDTWDEVVELGWPEIA